MNRKTKLVRKPPVKFQIYLGPELQLRFLKYLKENYSDNDRVYSIIFRKALAEFLDKGGH